MTDLITNYSWSEIVLFIIALAAAIKGIVTFWDWGKDRLKKVYDKDNKLEEFKKIITENTKKMEECTIAQNEIINELQDLKIKVMALTNSDKDDIKAWITEKHHFFCYQAKHIDDYSLDCIEKRYSHYVEEGGNSFISKLMEEIRALPKISTNESTEE